MQRTVIVGGISPAKTPAGRTDKPQAKSTTRRPPVPGRRRAKNSPYVVAEGSHPTVPTRRHAPEPPQKFNRRSSDPVAPLTAFTGSARDAKPLKTASVSPKVNTPGAGDVPPAQGAIERSGPRGGGPNKNAVMGVPGQAPKGSPASGSRLEASSQKPLFPPDDPSRAPEAARATGRPPAIPARAKNTRNFEEAKSPEPAKTDNPGLDDVILSYLSRPSNTKSPPKD